MMEREMVKVSRRDFLIGGAAAGAGFSLGMYLPSVRAGAAGENQDESPEVNAWVVIHPDDTVVIRIARSEMGQGTLTGLAQMVAEELECDWSKVTTEYPTPGQNLARDRVWGSFMTGGSQGIRGSHSYVRKGGAVARQMLIEAAAEAWGVPMAECSAADSVITHGPSSRTTTYGEVAAAAAELIPPIEVELKDPQDWKLIGKPVKRLDTAEKLTGAQIYGTDLQLPDMLNAAIKACPVFGGTLKSFDAAKVREMPGVRMVVRVDDDAVAVVADTWWQAKKALDALPVVWNDGPNAELDSAAIERMLDEGLEGMAATRRRYDGQRRNPFNEAECGHHYARAMASWAAVLAWSGFRYSAVTGTMTFAARPGRHFWSTGWAWGTAVVMEAGNGAFDVRVEVLHGTVALNAIELLDCGVAHRESTPLAAGRSWCCLIKAQSET